MKRDNHTSQFYELRNRDSTIAEKVRILTPTRSIESLDNSFNEEHGRWKSVTEQRNSEMLYHYALQQGINSTTIDLSSKTSHSAGMFMNFPFSTMRNAYDNYDIEQEWRKHLLLEKSEPDTKEALELKNKMNSLSMKFKHKNDEIYKVKYGIKKLDKRIYHLYSKIRRLTLRINQVNNENSDLSSLINNIWVSKILTNLL